MTLEKGKSKLTIGLGPLLGAIFLVSLLLVSIALASVNYFFDTRAAEEAAHTEFTSISLRSAQAAAQLNRRGERLALALSEQADLENAVDQNLHPLVRPMTQLMQASDHIFSLFVGYNDGTYLEVSDLEATADSASAWEAQPGERWVVVQIFDQDQGRTEVRLFLDSRLSVVRRREAPTDYRANERPWYLSAQTNAVDHTPPYLLSLIGQRGISITHGNDQGTVTGAILLLSSINEILAISRYPQTFGAVMFDAQGNIIADQGPLDTADVAPAASTVVRDDARFETLFEIARRQPELARLNEVSIGGELHFAWVQAIDSFGGPQSQQFIGITGTHREIFGRYQHQALMTLAISLGLALLLVPLVFLSTRIIARPIQQLTEQSNKVRKREFEAVEEVPTRIREVRWLSQSMKSMAVAIEDYEQKQRDLHDGFVKLIAAAIDHKSPYTGGHCIRVPAIAALLAEAASQTDDAPFHSFTLESEARRREFMIAAWLHDCGKITTPEHIVDKGSKLEANYNRIHEIRMRFEVMLRDEEIRFLRALRENSDLEPELRQAMAQRQQAIRDDFAFVATCNVGGEFMDDEAIERLRHIAQNSWTRTLNDRLGLAPLEEARLADFPSQTPCQEPVLGDRPEHRIARDNDVTRFERFGFTLKPTALKQNLGEIYNLSIRRGTLTAEDRYLINEHICSTIEMLETLPWPEDLAQVPEIAGGHHEKMDGTGYPRSLDKNQLSIAARIMAVADVLEALTAADRPYKKAKTMSQSLGIMRKMALDKHIDADIFRLLIRTGAYRAYADTWLAPEQIDEIDEEALLNDLPAPA